MNSKTYRSCGVPKCTNTSIKTPNKLFVLLPYEKTTRAKWLKLARRDLKGVFPTTQLYFCEDHFDLPNDMENYMKYHVMGYVSQIRMKPGCIPTRFDCQPDRSKRTSSTITKRQYMAKKQRQMLIAQCEKEMEGKSFTEQFEYGATSSTTSGSLRCSFCSSPLQKIYKCVQCEDVLLCDKCERKDRHPIHCVLRIASEELYVKVKGTFPALYRLFDMLLKEEEVSDGGDSEATSSDLEYEVQKISAACSNVTDSMKDLQNTDIKSHSKVIDHKMCFGNTDTKPQAGGNSRKRNHNTVVGNTKNPNSVEEVNTKIDETTINFTEVSCIQNVPYINIKTEPAEEDNIVKLESMDVIIEHDIKLEVKEEPDIKPEVKEEPGDEDISEKASAATVTYLYRAPNNVK